MIGSGCSAVHPVWLWFGFGLFQLGLGLASGLCFVAVGWVWVAWGCLGLVNGALDWLCLDCFCLVVRLGFVCVELGRFGFVWFGFRLISVRGVGFVYLCSREKQISLS